ncbi:MAG: hypothetical protein AAB363_09725 [Planctomycetota bacterium]
MTYRGQVKNGVVVLEDASGLSEGTVVRVEPLPQLPRKHDGTESIFRLADRAKPTGIRDLAINHDHYLYGHPKVSHG